MLLVSSIGPTLRRLAPLHPDYLGVLWMPRMGNDPASTDGLNLPWAIDNGAYTGFDADKFERLCKSFDHREDCLFVVSPDVVGEAARTLDLFGMVRGRIRGWGYQRVALAAQDGLEDLDVPWDDFEVLFVGGTTGWKLSRAADDLIGEAKRRDMWVHVGRVNSVQRLYRMMDLGADSIDGSRCTWFPDTYIPGTIAAIKAHEKQGHLFMAP